MILDFEQKQQQIKANQHNELTSKGADTQRIHGIDTEISQIKLELDLIEENRKLVVEYEKDKLEFVDKIPELENNKISLDRKLKIGENKYQQDKKESE